MIKITDVPNSITDAYPSSCSHNYYVVIVHYEVTIAVWLNQCSCVCTCNGFCVFVCVLVSYLQAKYIMCDNLYLNLHMHVQDTGMCIC